MKYQAPDEYVGSWELVEGSCEQEDGLRASTTGMATAVMKRRGGHEVNVGRPRKKPRSKSYTTGLAIDNALRTTTGAGFEQFLPPPAEFAAPAEWKFLSMAPDQGPDVVALTQWLLHKQRINLEVTWDLNHGSWNDIKLMYRDAGLWPHILLMTAAQNVGFGSELSPNRMKQIRQCFADYQCICNPRTCPVFQHFLPLILAEQKSLVRLSYEGQAEDEVWNNMRNDPVLTNMGERVNLGRCFGLCAPHCTRLAMLVEARLGIHSCGNDDGL